MATLRTATTQPLIHQRCLEKEGPEKQGEMGPPTPHPPKHQRATEQAYPKLTAHMENLTGANPYAEMARRLRQMFRQAG